MTKERQEKAPYLRKLRIYFSVVVVALSVYILLTKDFHLMTYNMFLLSVFLLIMGIYELKNERKLYGYMNVAASLFGFFVSFQAYILNNVMFYFR